MVLKMFYRKDVFMRRMYCDRCNCATNIFMRWIYL